MQRAQIGHIPRTMAAKLARYMDSRSLLVEGYITGRKEAFDCPIELRLYGTSEPVERRNLIAQMKSDRLPVGDANVREREQAMAEKERQKMLAQAAKAAKKNSGAVVGSARGMQWENGVGEYAAGTFLRMGGVLNIWWFCYNVHATDFPKVPLKVWVWVLAWTISLEAVSASILEMLSRWRKSLGLRKKIW